MSRSGFFLSDLGQALLSFWHAVVTDLGVQTETLTLHYTLSVNSPTSIPPWGLSSLGMGSLGYPSLPPSRNFRVFLCKYPDRNGANMKLFS